MTLSRPMNNALRIRPITSPVMAIATLFCLMPLCDHASAWSRVGAIEVTDHAGKPCFGLPKKERKRIGETPQVFGVEVYDAITPPLRQQWSFEFAYPASLPLPPGACVLYGEVPANAVARQTSMPLKPGRLYDVSMSATRTGATQFYSARFCLKANADGSLHAIQVRYDDGLGWSPAVCLP
ncbi:MAG: hypothetical protein WCC51_05645 [Stenotrophomonas indicatrix]|uniref:hypothetical protein n=1 Tax=Stenotrophomonas indicatrix TaxID=2045451 RepID=UPI003C79DF76